MSHIFTVCADDVIEQIMIQCWVFEARDGNSQHARWLAERTLERLLSKGLPYTNGPKGLLLDPYAANNMLKSRKSERCDEAWDDWQRTTRRNALSLPAAPHRYRLSLRREWHSYSVHPGRPVVLRMPLPLRQAQQGSAKVRVLEPSTDTAEIREMPGRVELRIAPSAAQGPIVAELEVDFVSGETLDSMAQATELGAAADARDEVWLRDREGLIAPSAAVSALGIELAQQCSNAREFVHTTWHWLMRNLRFGDVHRVDVDANDPLGSVLQNRVADCMLGSSLLISLCRARGIPARLVTGYLMHPANIGPHSWAEIRVSPEQWIPVDYGSWCYCAGDVDDPEWGKFFLGRSDARFLAEVSPRDFTGWGSSPPPERWYRMERLRNNRIEHTLHTLPDGSLFRLDSLDMQILGPA